ncbi:recombinase family protein [Pseudodesulfovibrio piezophilus]|uniref:Putative Transposon Tn21 resolvase n=1 Tax=Pseudodesulfovibrio piezophilus (strain DSM 21447 / JCM 15486 / C1TLV30) TaxID=1322246 RepID=M1WLV5_PSEP2|nr:recombinase family protein [Pseudodesulfovibrio piezophilus]CCH48520.1 putative Transposon Tn21 resolvase [Pseudodesulfovibrio piezophilus C1TLV30]
MDNTQDPSDFHSYIDKPGRKISYSRLAPTNKTKRIGGLITEILFVDKAGCKTAELRPELEACLDFLEANDVLFVESMAHLGRNTRELVDLVQQITDKEAGVFFVDEDLGLDPSRPDFETNFRWMQSMYDFERTLAQERRNEGLLEAKKKGVRLGRPTKINDEQRKEIRNRFTHGEKAFALAKEYGVSESLVYQIGKLK